MTALLVIAACVVVVGILAVFWEIRKLRAGGNVEVRDENAKLREALVRMESSVNSLKENQQSNIQGIQQQMQQSSSQMNERLTKAAVELAKVQEHTASMKELQQILKSPKLRGGVGEDLMAKILKDNLPRQSYALQHRFRSGEAVDAVVKVQDSLIPIDSKFPVDKYLQAQNAPEAERPRLLKEFHKQVKKHIDDIAKKYILPAEKTMSYAVMYVPGEPVFQEISAAPELTEHAMKKKVFLVSPTSFVYFLILVLKSLEGAQIEERAQEVLTALQSIQQDSLKLGGELAVLNKHVTSAGGSMDRVTKSYGKLGSKIENTGKLQEKQVEEVAELPEEPADLEELLEIKK